MSKDPQGDAYKAWRRKNFNDKKTTEDAIKRSSAPKTNYEYKVGRDGKLKEDNVNRYVDFISKQKEKEDYGYPTRIKEPTKVEEPEKVEVEEGSVSDLSPRYKAAGHKTLTQQAKELKDKYGYVSKQSKNKEKIPAWKKMQMKDGTADNV